MEDYEYLNKSRREVDGVDDREEWGALKVSLVGRFSYIRDRCRSRLRLTQ